MKKLLLILTVAAVAFACGEMKKNEGFVIKGNSNIFGGKIYLQVLEGKVPVSIDSTQIQNGVFEFAGKVKMPMFAQLADSTGRNLLSFYLENSDINITVDGQAKPMLKITGSKEDSTYREFQTMIDTVTNENNYNKILASFVEANPKSVVAAYVFFRMMSPRLNADQMRDYYAKFDTTVQKSVYLKMVKEKAELLDKTAVGTKFVDFELPNTKGEMVKLSDVAGKGQWVLLDFWASWCAPCRKENPNVVAAFEQFGKKGFTVFGVSLDKNKEAWVEAIAKDKLNWTNVSDLKFWNCAPAMMYGVGSIPSNVLINPDGIIAARNLKGEDLISFLSQNIK